MVMQRIKRHSETVSMLEFPKRYPLAPSITLRFYREGVRMGALFYYVEHRSLSLDYGRTYFQSEPLRLELFDLCDSVCPNALPER
jgi:hypothetical protein